MHRENIAFYRSEIQKIISAHPSFTPYEVLNELMRLVYNKSTNPFALKLINTLKYDEQRVAWRQVETFLALNKNSLPQNEFFSVFIAYFYYYGDYLAIQYPLPTAYPQLNKLINKTIPSYLNQTVWMHTELRQMLKKGIYIPYFTEAQTVTLRLLSATNQATLAQNQALADIITNICTDRPVKFRNVTHFNLLLQLDLPDASLTTLYHKIINMRLETGFAYIEIKAIIYKIARTKPELVDIKALINSSGYPLRIALDYLREMSVLPAQLEPFYPRIIELLYHQDSAVSFAAERLLLSNSIPEDKKTHAVNLVIDYYEYHLKQRIYVANLEVMQHALTTSILPEPCRDRLVSLMLKTIEQAPEAWVTTIVNDLLCLGLTQPEQTSLVNTLVHLVENGFNSSFVTINKFNFAASNLVNTILNKPDIGWWSAYHFAYTSEDYQQISRKLILALDETNLQRRMYACNSMGTISDEYVTEITTRLLNMLDTTTDPGLQSTICGAFKQISPPAEYSDLIIARLRPFSQHHDAYVRMSAYVTLLKYATLSKPIFTEAELLSALTGDIWPYERRNILAHFRYLSHLSPDAQAVILSEAQSNCSNVSINEDVLLHALKVSEFPKNVQRDIINCCVKLSFTAESPRYQYLVNMPRTMEDNYHIIKKMVDVNLPADIVLHTVHIMPIAANRTESLCEVFFDELNEKKLNEPALHHFFNCLNYLARNLSLAAKSNIWIRLEDQYVKTGCPHFLLFSHNFRRDQLVRERLENLIHENCTPQLPDDIWSEINRQTFR